MIAPIHKNFRSLKTSEALNFKSPHDGLNQVDMAKEIFHRFVP